MEEIMHGKQLRLFFVLLLVYALSAFLTYAFFTEQLTTSMGFPMPELPASPLVLGLANAGIILVAYGLLGLLGYWFARKVGLPGIFDPEGNSRRWFEAPFAIGFLCGVALVVGDLLLAPYNGLGRFPHPAFPVSILASLSAGIGEEIAFRGFVFGLWALLLTWLLKRWSKGRAVALALANLIAALAFAAGHLPSATFLTGVEALKDLNPVLVAEIFLLNGVVGLAAGRQHIKTGLVAAMGVHFWTDVFWHVLYGLVK